MKINTNKVLSFILDDRKKTPWGKSLGMSPSAITKMFNHGVYPADKYLTKIMKVENASLDALWGAAVAPFIVQRTNHARETNLQLDQHLRDEKQNIYLITSETKVNDEYPVFVLSVPVVENIGGVDELKYESVHVITGPTNHETANLLREESVNFKTLPEKDFRELATGYKGTYFLFGKGNLLDAKPIEFTEMNSILCKEATNSAALLNRVMELVDESILEEGADVSPEQHRKLVVELYSYALKEGLIKDEVNPNIAQSMLRII
jgi:hypothetical protein